MSLHAHHEIWRWHFRAGVLVAPVLMLLAVTGGLYLYSIEIEQWWYRDALHVERGDRMLPLAQQERAVRADYPGAKPQRILWPLDADTAAQWPVATADGRALDVFVDPYTARITGEVEHPRRLMTVVSNLHGELLLGRFGTTVVELVACWTVVLVVTGLHLWWPWRCRTGGVFWPRTYKRGRTWWRDLHAVPAAWNGLFVAFLVLSGLPWSGFWGEQLARLGTLSATTAPTPNFHEPPSRLPAGEADAHALHRVATTTENKELPWTIRHAEVAHAPRITRDVGIGAIENILYRSGLATAGPRLRLLYPQDKVVEWGVMTHLGLQFGRWNRRIALGVCIVIVATLSTGLVMWWRRRPPGQFGAPDVPASQRLPPGLKAVLTALALLFPLVGASIAVVWLIGHLRVRWARPG